MPVRQGCCAAAVTGSFSRTGGPGTRSKAHPLRPLASGGGHDHQPRLKRQMRRCFRARRQALQDDGLCLSGLLSVLVGVLYAAQYRQAKADAGTGWELDAIAAVLNDIDSNTQLVLKGLIIVIAMFLQQTDYGRGGWFKRIKSAKPAITRRDQSIKSGARTIQAASARGVPFNLTGFSGHAQANCPPIAHPARKPQCVRPARPVRARARIRAA